MVNSLHPCLQRFQVQTQFVRLVQKVPLPTEPSHLIMASVFAFEMIQLRNTVFIIINILHKNH